MFPPHRLRSVWQGFNVNQAHWSVLAGIFCSPPKIMLPGAPLGVGRPSGVIGAVIAFDNITVVSHLRTGSLFRIIQILEPSAAGEHFSQPLPGCRHFGGGDMFPVVGLAFVEPQYSTVNRALDGFL